ncbi:hypothetical protein NBRC110019_20770 [Neptunitalea chrysea]|uniref:Uncharacterized protein n=1 Tax=Neptunitalea chrysea TaxID=1647581 RepID=A0A9W6B7Y1_9FLAO|nr:hypothetical protein NBRC110019_20770 [Neptunitalea chrysea]
MHNNKKEVITGNPDQVHTLQEWMIEGMPDFEMVNRAMQQWCINRATAREYLRQAYRNWKTDKEIELENRRNAKIAELQQLKYTMKEEYAGTPNGIRAILSIEKEIMRLSGLDVQKVDVTSDGKSVQYMPIWGTVDPILDEDTTDHSSKED